MSWYGVDHNCGWECPKCKRIYSPFRVECVLCNQSKIQLPPETFYNTVDNINAGRLLGIVADFEDPKPVEETFLDDKGSLATRIKYSIPFF